MSHPESARLYMYSSLGAVKTMMKLDFHTGILTIWYQIITPFVQKVVSRDRHAHAMPCVP